MTPKVNIWSPAAVKLLEDMTAAGRTRAATAAALTRKFRHIFTKNAVCGKVARMGLSPTPTFDKPPKPPKVRKPPPVVKVQVMGVPSYTPVKGHPGGCQFLIGAASKRLFCHKPTIRSWAKSSGSWCAEHEAIVYLPQAKKLGHVA